MKYSFKLNLLLSAGCPQADEQKVRNGIPGGQEVTEFDECGGLVSRKDALYRVYTFSTCLAKLTCGQEAEMIGRFLGTTAIIRISVY